MIVRCLCIGLITSIYMLFYIPLFILILNSFNISHFGMHWDGFTTKWYVLLAHNDSLVQAVEHSLIVALLSSTFATGLGFLTAIVLYRYHFILKKFIKTMLFVVLISPDIVMAISLLVLFLILRISLGLFSLLCSHITFCLPFVVITVYSRLKGFDVLMLEAARDLGAKEFTILKKILLPLTLPSVIASWLLSFTLSMDDVVVSSFISSPTFEILPLKIFSMVKVGVSPEINALSTILTLLSLLLVASSQWLLRNKNNFQE